MDGEEVIEVPLTQGQVAIIDREDWDLVKAYNWQAVYSKTTNTYYADTSIRENGKQRKVRMHRLILGASKGTLVDHINGNTLDNRRSSNLRLCNHSQNSANKRKCINSSSRFKGVSRAGNKWQAEIAFNKQRCYLGVFKTPEAAHAVYCEAAIMLHGKFANFGEMDAPQMEREPDFRTYPEIAWDQRLRIDNTSGEKGVFRQSNLWRVRIQFLGRDYSLGYFDDLKQASTIYQKADAIRHQLGPDTTHSDFLTAIMQLKSSCQRRTQINNSSGYIGVVRHHNRWIARIGFLGTRYQIGRFDTPEQASLMYEQAAALRRDLGPEASPTEFRAAIDRLRASFSGCAPR